MVSLDSSKAFSPPPTIMLVVVTALWGLSFPLMKNWNEAAKNCPAGSWAASCTLIALRMFLALAVLGVCQPRLFVAPRRREYRAAFVIGAVFFLGFALQVEGLHSTSPALSAFITSLGSAWVPVLAWIWFRITSPGITLVGLAVGVFGTYVLSQENLQGTEGGRGELLTLAASVLFAVEILLLDRLGRTVHSANLTVPFLAFAGFLSLVTAAVKAAAECGWQAWLEWLLVTLRDESVALDLALLTLLCTVLAFHWMNVYQPKVPAARVALIYLLEPVFASAFSILWGKDVCSGRLLIGGGLILVGNVLVELPGWIRRGTGLRSDREGV
jgi:drug/metabolite transporter (DMT)-like permease